MVVASPERLIVAWCSLEAAPALPGMRAEACEPGALGALADAHLIALDARAFASVEALFEARRSAKQPALILAAAEQLGAVLAGLSHRDEIALLGSPPELLAYRLGQLRERALSWRDSLTGLADRQVFLEHLAAGVDKAAPERPLSLLFVDIDRFKQVNDQHGHAVGDIILHALARRIVTSTSPQALVARFGGEEFCLLMRATEAEAIAEAELIREIVRGEPLHDGIRITVSVGVATALGPLRRRELLSKAEEALFAAKVRGRDCVIHHAEIERRALAVDGSLALEGFENLTRVISERIAEVITHRGRRLFEELRKEAEVDVLTQLHNRRYLDRRLEYVFGSTASTGQPLTVALLDVDHFGQVNKRWGWPTGDKALRDLSALIVGNVRGQDWAARYGGEEICLVMQGAEEGLAAQALERLRALIEAHPFESTDGSPLPLTVSIGLSERRAQDGSVRDLMERVSLGLGAAKAGGRNRVCVAPEVVDDRGDG